jgi:hypothetical protein
MSRYNNSKHVVTVSSTVATVRDLALCLRKEFHDTTLLVKGDVHAIVRTRVNTQQWRTEGGLGGGSTPPPPNSAAWPS